MLCVVLVAVLEVGASAQQFGTSATSHETLESCDQIASVNFGSTHLVVLVAVLEAGACVQEQHVAGAQPHVAHVGRDLDALHDHLNALRSAVDRV